MAKEKLKHYLSNKELVAEIIECKAQDRLSRKAENMFCLLGKKLMNKMYYHNQDDRNDCYQAGMLGLLLQWRSFNPDKSDNAFAYYTEVFKRAMAKGWGELYARKGDPDKAVKVFSLSGRANNDEAGGMFNI